MKARKKKLCNKCNSVTRWKDTTKGYYCNCPNCDEDLFSIETHKSKKKIIKKKKQ